MSKPIFIHAGAHRTGTSSFQLCLHENQQVLRGQGIDLAYPGRDGVPGGALRMRLPGPRHADDTVAKFATNLRQHLRDLSPDNSRSMILSDENIPGRMFHFYQGQFFPAAKMRFMALAQALVNRPAHIIYVLRSYDEMFISAYRKRAEDNAVHPFNEVVAGFMAMDRGWPELVALMRDILRPQTISVLPYERRGQSRELLAQLVPDLSRDQLVEPAQTMNQSATDAALFALQEKYRAGEKLSRPQWQSVVRDHAGDRTQNGFAVFSKQDAEMLETRYQIDLTRVAELDGVAFL